MITNLKLSSNELLLYAMIYGFSQDGQSKFNGSLNYITTALNCSKNTALNSLKSLVEKGFIFKNEVFSNNVKFTNYGVNFNFVGGGAKIELPVQNTKLGSANFVMGGAEIGHNNTIYNNNTKDNIINISETEFSSTEPSKKNESELFPETRINTNYDFGEEMPKKVAQKKIENEKLTLFRNSDVYKMVNFDVQDYSEFEKLFKGPEFEPINLVYYFHSVSDWSDQKNVKRTKNGWIATIRNFIRGDAEKNKVKLKPEFKPNKDNDDQAMLDILNGNF